MAPSSSRSIPRLNWLRHPMISLGLDQVRSVLLIGAHSDDIEIGCGATVLRLLEERPSIELTWIVLSANGTRRDEAQASAESFLAAAKSAQIKIEGFRDGFFPYDGAAVKERFEALKEEVSPDLIFCHYGADRHQDHRLVSELTWNTFRNHCILEYEIPKYDGDLGSPNVFAPVSDAQRERKIEILLKCFPSQATKHWFAAETFAGLMRLRGLESNAPNGYAEAFYARKIQL